MVGAYVSGDPGISVTKKRIYARTPGVEKFMEIQLASQRTIDKCPASK